MVDPLRAWWAQQLVLCGWAFEPDPSSVDADLALARLRLLEVRDRGELGWRLLEACGPGRPDPLSLLQALELVALAGAAGWLPATRTDAWRMTLIRHVHDHYPSLDAWLEDLRHARSEQGWLQGDDGFFEACEALAQLERDEEGITWERLGNVLHDHTGASRDGALWPEAPDEIIWRARASFAPVMAFPAAESLDWPEVRGWLAEVWSIHDRDELIRILLWLAGQGHRYGWDLDASRLLARGREARETWLAELDEENTYGEVLLGFLRQGEPLEWAAWDWLRLVDLAYAGHVAGWLGSEEASHFAAHGVDLLSRRYSDWTALAQAYQRGRSLFEGRDHLTSFNQDWALLLHSSVSPWRRPLAELLDESTREASRHAIRAWRADPWHWVLALASIREPDLLYRQGVPPLLDDTRQEDARRYLDEVLGMEPGRQGEALARCWLPAQAHHLNQLAADAAHGALPEPATLFGRPQPGALLIRDALKTCARHAATIYMAEKYAFHLLMAADSGHVEASASASLAKALRDALSHFYADSRRLLEAWIAWESALPESEGEGDSLAYEIRWHAEDMGSLFHWLDWHHGDWKEPGARMSLPRFTALALAGPLNAAIWSEPVPESGRESDEVRHWLDAHYGLHSPESLHEFLDFLVEAGDRQEYQINYAPYTLNAARLAEEIAILESGECDEEARNHLLRLQRVRDNDAGCNEHDMTAWDVAQVVDLATAGRQVGWLSRERFEAYLEASVKLAQAHYGDWREYARGLYTGYAFFMGETPDRESFLASFREALIGWLTGAPPLSGPWSSLDFPGARPRHWAPVHIDTLPGDARTLH
ncbi:hypothetical protein GCM10027040_21690 [Halomonas shantousis]